MRACKNSYVMLYDKNDILVFLDYNSNALFEKVQKAEEADRFCLLRKYLTHSDISTIGKPTSCDKKGLAEKYINHFILYYDNVNELSGQKKLPTAAQSNIVLPKEFYEITNISTYEENERRKKAIDWPALLPKDSLDTYVFDDFEKIRKYNGKATYSKSKRNQISNFDFLKYEYGDDNNYYEFDRLTIAAHGIGTNADKLMAHMRRTTFKGDVLNILVDFKEHFLYLFFERNERYFSLLNEINNSSISPPIWREYSAEDKKTITLVLYALDKMQADINGEPIIRENQTEAIPDEIANILSTYYEEYNKKTQSIIDSGQKPKYRWYQTKWREVLIKLDEIAFHSKGYAVCAFSGLKGKYEKLGRLFIASHIKPYAQCVAENDYESAFDPHNGLILSANADALFDQHLITVDVDDNGKILRKSAVDSISRIKNIVAKDAINNQYLTEKRKIFLRMRKMKFDMM